LVLKAKVIIDSLSGTARFSDSQKNGSARQNKRISSRSKGKWLWTIRRF